MPIASMPLATLSKPTAIARAHTAAPLIAKPIAVSWFDVVTLVLWVGCLLIGIVGSLWRYPLPAAVKAAPAPTQAEILNVALTTEPLLPPDAPPSSDASAPPPLAEPTALPSAPPLVPVAAPSPAIAFARPVEGPTQMVDTKIAVASRIQPHPNAVAAAAPAPPVHQLTFGQGEGKQPSPEYPARAMREGQEGTVRVRFSVNSSGRVAWAEIAAPSPWALLNEAAVRVIRERWRFQAGALRLYEVSIRFELSK